MRNRRSPDEVKQRILVAAEELFAEKGFSATTIREIAERANVNSAMIYYYFKDKKGLYRSVIDFSANETYRMLLKAFKGRRDPAMQLKEFCIEYARAHYLNRDIVKLIHREMLTNGEDPSGFSRIYFKKSMETVKEILERGVETGRFKKIDVDLAAATLFGLILFIFLTEPIVTSLKNLPSLDEAAVVSITESLTEIFLSGIINS